MATSHFCNGKWRAGSLAECNRHKRLDQRQVTVYNRESERGPVVVGLEWRLRLVDQQRLTAAIFGRPR